MYADAFLDAAYLFNAVQTENSGAAGIRPAQAFDDFKRGCLARPVFTEEAEDLSLENLEADSFQDLAVSIDLYKILDFDDGIFLQGITSLLFTLHHRMEGKPA